MPEPTPILHVVNCLTMGGSERQMLLLVRASLRRGFRPYVGFLQRAAGDLEKPLGDMGCEPIELPLRGGLLQRNTFQQVARLVDYARERGVRLVHAHDLYANVIGLLTARSLKVPFVASRRDLADWRPWRERMMLRLVTRSAERVLVNARPILTLARRDGAPPSRLRLVPNGLDLDEVDVEARRAPDPPLPDVGPDMLRVVMIGNMERPHKGHADLLAATAQLARAGLQLTLLLPSDGKLRGALELRARSLGIEGRVHFLGRRHDTLRVLGHADLVVHPSWSEGFPNAVLEALSLGRPVVATRVGGCPDLIEHGVTGLLVEPRQPEALAAAMESLLRDRRAAAALGQRARHRVRAQYRIEVTAAEVERLYAELGVVHTAPCPDEAALPESA